MLIYDIFPVHIQSPYFVPIFYIKTEVCNWYFFNVIFSIISFWVDIFNICIICIWLNAAYIMPKFSRAILQCNRSIGLTLFYHKQSLIWLFIFVYSIIIEHDFISDFIVMVNSFMFQLFYQFCGYYIYSFASDFADILIPNPPYVLLGESYHGQIIIIPDYNISTYLFLRKLKICC